MVLRPATFSKRLLIDEMDRFDAARTPPAGQPGASPYRSGTAERRILDARQGVGYEDLVHVSDGLYFIVCNRLCSVDQYTNFVGEGALKLHFRLSGHSTIILHDGEQVDIDGAFCGVMLQPQGLDKGEIDRAGTAERWATICCRSGFLRDALGVEIDVLPEPLQRFLAGKPYDLYNRALPLTPMMSHALHGLLESPMSGALRNVQAEGQCLDLVSQVLDVLRRDGPDATTIRLSSRDAESVRQARDILEREFAAPCSG